MDYSKQSKVKLAGTVLAIVVIPGVVVLADHFKNSSSTTAASTTTPTTSTATTSTSDTTDTTSPSTISSSTSSSATYKDGTYTASSSYYVPHGNETIAVTLTIKDGVITDSSIQNSEGDHDSAFYQEEFTNEYKGSVVGKALSGLHLSRVAGASDTTDGFNDALDQIASQAQA